MKWIARIEGKMIKLYAGYLGPEFPKLLLIDWRGKANDLSEAERSFLSTMLEVMSDFTLYVDGSTLKKLNSADLLRMLQYISNSYVTSFRFLLGVVKREEEEHTKPDVIGHVHRKLKMPLAIVEEPKRCIYAFRVEEDIARPLALTFSSLFTSSTRRGGEVRQVVAQLLLYLIGKCGRSEYSKILSLMVRDTYEWYREHAEKVGEAKAAELRYLAVSIRQVEQIEERAQRVGEGLRGDAGLLGLVRSYIDIIGVENEFLIGRLDLIRTALQTRGKFEHVITVATGQWGVAQIALISELTGAKSFDVLYTQNSLWTRLFEEYCRRKVLREHVKTSCTVEYHPMSATDSLVTQMILEEILSKTKRDRSLILAQGPASIATPLYLLGKERGVTSVMV